MNVMCPVCNSFQALQAACRHCGGWMEDAGKLSDYYGDYSPYRPIDDAKQTNGLPDLAQHLCVHVAWCPSCRREQRVAVREVTDVELYALEQGG